MSRIAILSFSLLALAIAGCEHPQTLRFNEDMAPVPALRVEGDFKYYSDAGWEVPKLPGTPEAEGRDGHGPPDGGGIAFRFHSDFSHREVRDEDEVRTGEYAVVEGVTFNPGIVEGAFRINREDFGFKFLFFTRHNVFSAGIGIFWTELWINGSVKNPTTRSEVTTRNWGPGFSAFIEISPFLPELRVYGQWTAWNAYDGGGYMSGSDTEFGIKGRYRGIWIFGGYRMENFAGKTEHSVGESRLTFEIKGPVFGIGASF